MDRPEERVQLLIGRHRQRVRRVFNRSSFDHGGRFYGAWWQACPKVWRREIFINDAPTIEQDYSSLHIALLYSRRGVDYFKTGRLKFEVHHLDLARV